MEILREQYLDYMLGRNVGLPLFVELMGPLVGLDAEWRAQGATEEEINLSAFGFDHVRVHRLEVDCGILGGRDEVIEEDSEHILRADRYGRRTMLCKRTATIPLPLDHPVTDMESWLKIKPRYAYATGRISEGCIESAHRARKDGALVVAGIPGGFDEPRQLMGEEAVCMAYYDEPELIHDMLDTIGGTAWRLLDEISREVDRPAFRS